MRLFTESTDGLKYNEGDLNNHSGIGAIIRNDKNEILMLEHIKFGFWTIPVGKVDKGDSLQKTLYKELKEEVNIEVDDYEFVSMETRKYKRKGKTVKVKQYLYIIKEWTGKVKNNEKNKHSDLQWMTLDKIERLNNISDSTKAMIRHFNIMEETG
jgi:8-oxo-dGTP pyrophosphatase MutT (NUDIX family)